MRKETQSPYPICPVCKKPILSEQRPTMVFSNGEEAHIPCYLDATDEEERQIKEKKEAEERKKKESS